MAGYNEDGTPRLRYDESGNVVGYSGQDNTDTSAPVGNPAWDAFQNELDAKQWRTGRMDYIGGANDRFNLSDPLSNEYTGWTGAQGYGGSTVQDYYDYLYGPGGGTWETSPYDGKQYFKPHAGVGNFKPGASQAYLNADRSDTDLVRNGIIAMAGMGMGGMLPGTESAFSSLGGVPDAAWGVNPANSAATATELGTNLANSGNWAALDALAGVPAGATYGAEALTLGAGGLTADTAAALAAGASPTVPTSALTQAAGSTGAQQAIDGSAQTIYDANPTIPGTAFGTGAGVGTGLGGFLDSLVGTESGDINWGQLGGALLNYFGNQNAADDLAQAGQTAASMSNPLNDPKRAGYQADLQNLLSNPSAFYENNPVVKAQMDLAKNQFVANSAKMGVGGTQFNNYLKNVQTNAAGTFNDQANLLAELGGYKFNSSNSGSQYMQGQTGAANANQNSLQGFANIFGGSAGGGNDFDISKIFGGIMNSLG